MSVCVGSYVKYSTKSEFTKRTTSVTNSPMHILLDIENKGHTCFRKIKLPVIDYFRNIDHSCRVLSDPFLSIPTSSAMMNSILEKCLLLA